MDVEFLQGISLTSIHMHSCRHERGPGSLNAGQAVDTSGQLQPLGDLDPGSLGYLVTLEYRITNEKTDEEVATGEVSYVASYALAAGVELTDEQIETFGRHGALFQVHPFLREHLATMCQRSGLATYPLPILLHDPTDEESDREPRDGT